MTGPKVAATGSGHWHAVPVSRVGVTVEDEHERWHESREPCVFCGSIRWTAPGHHLTTSGLPLAPCYRADTPSLDLVARARRDVEDARSEHGQATERFGACVRLAHADGHKMAAIASACGLTLQRISQILSTR